MDKKESRTMPAWYMFLPICIVLGTALGAVMGNVGVGLACGAALGTTLNLYFYYQNDKSSQD